MPGVPCADGGLGVTHRAGHGRGLPAAIVCDNGPEFTSRHLDQWAHERGIELSFIGPGKPVENVFAESFNGTFREECLNEHLSLSLQEARREIEEWRVDYNEVRPHSSLGNLAPSEFAAQHGVEKFKLARVS